MKKIYKLTRVLPLLVLVFMANYAIGQEVVNTAFGPETGVFTLEFDVVPSHSPMNGGVGLSDGDVGTWGDMSCIIGFHQESILRVYNGDITGYEYDNEVMYEADGAYHFVMDVDVPNKRYSVSVTPAGGDETVLATDYAFRADATELTTYASYNDTNTTFGGIPGATMVVTNFSSSTPPQPATAKIYTSENPPVIDGDLADWDDIEAHDMNWVENGVVTSPEDYSAYWKAVWKDTMFYALAVIKDDTLYNEGMAFWNHDAINFYAGWDNARDGTGGGTSPDDHKYLYHHWWGEAAGALGLVQDMPDAQVNVFDLADGSGWAIEWSAPFAQLDANGFGFVPEEGAKFLWDVVSVDDDDEIDPFLIRGWSPDAGGGNFGNMDLAGEAELAGAPPVTYAQAKIYTDNTPPTIDGDFADWDNIEAHPMDWVENGVVTSPEDYSAYWKAVWNDTTLYVMAEIKDDTLYNEGSPFWNHDAINFYAGWDNDRNGAGGGTSPDDHKYLYHHWWGEAVDALGLVQDMPDAQVNVVDLADGSGWAIEWSAPFAQLDANGFGFVPEEGAKFQFDVVAVDDDDELDPFLIRGWSPDAGGGNFGNMDKAGEAELAGAPPITVKQAVIHSNLNPPAIDGDISDWDGIDAHPMDWVENGVVTTPEDYSAYWKAVWNDTMFYAMAEIKDDTLYNEGSPFWNHDAINFYAGWDNARDGAGGGTSPDDHKYLYQHWWGEAADALGLVQDMPGAQVSVIDLADGSGWAIEWSAPFSQLDANDFGFVPENGAKFLFDVVAVDDDDELDPFLIRGWADGAGGGNFGNMDLAGEATLGGVQPTRTTVFSTATPPAIDGDISDWDGIDGHEMNYVEDGSTQIPSDFSGQWKAVWSDDAIYLMAEINDDTLYNEGSPFWNHDALNFYFGMDNVRDGTGASNGDHKYLFNHWWGFADDRLDGTADLTGVEVAKFDKADGSGWALEWRVPFDQLDANGFGFVAEEGAKFQFDVVAVDDDDEIDPFVIRGWADQSGGMSFVNMDNIGEVTLGGALAPPITKTQVFSVNTPPAIDGDYSDWTFIDGHEMNYVEDGSTQTASDFSGEWKAVWTDDAIYVYAGINDDTLYNEGSPFWNHDALNFYFGVDNVRDGTGASNSMHKYLFNHWWGFADDELGGTDGLTGVEVAKRDRADGSGWDFEWKIPFDQLDANDFGFVAEAGAKLQFDVVAVDDDDEVDPFRIRGWAQGSGGMSFVNMDMIGEIELAIGSDPFSPSKTQVDAVDGALPLIDGDISDWDGITGHSMDYVEDGSTQIPSDFSGEWKAIWDSDAFYMMADINDDTLYNEGSPFWNHDALNFYFGLDNDRNGDGAGTSPDDHKYLFNHWWGFADDEMGGTADLTGVEVAKFDKADGSGWVIEWKIPFDQLDANGFGLVPEAGTKFLFDVVAVDDDDALDPFVIRGWADGAGGMSFGNMDFAGEVELVGMPTAVNDIDKASTFRVYPNPVNDELIVSQFDGVQNISLFNMTGQRMLEINLNGSETQATLDMGHLAKGLYLLTVTSERGIATRKVIKQ